MHNIDNATIKYTGMMRVIRKFTDSREVSRGSSSLASNPGSHPAFHRLQYAKATKSWMRARVRGYQQSGSSVRSDKT